MQASKGRSRVDLHNPDGRSQGHKWQWYGSATHVRAHSLLAISALDRKRAQGSPCLVGHPGIAEISMWLQLWKLGLTKEGQLLGKGQLVCAIWFNYFPAGQPSLYTDTEGGNIAYAWQYSLWILNQTLKREVAPLSLLHQELQVVLYPLLSLWFVCWGESCTDHKCQHIPSPWTRQLF